MPLPFDATLKSLVAEHPGDFARVFGLPTGEPVTAVNADLSTVSAATDVALAYGDPFREIVDLNFQTGPTRTCRAACTCTTRPCTRDTTCPCGRSSFCCGRKPTPRI